MPREKQATCRLHVHRVQVVRLLPLGGESAAAARWSRAAQGGIERLTQRGESCERVARARGNFPRYRSEIELGRVEAPAELVPREKQGDGSIGFGARRIGR